MSSEASRVPGLSVTKAIVYGNHSKHFGKKRDSDGHTHEWVVYVKPFNNEDMSNYVKKVTFRLHDSYTNPTRAVFKPPYEVCETGWGEFEVQIKIHFMDPAERTLTLYHVLKLFHSSGPGSAGGANAQEGGSTTMAMVQGRKTVVSEYYDEIVFQEPTQYIHTLLTNTRPITLSAYKHETDFEDRQKRTLENIGTGRGKVQAEIKDFKTKLQLAKETIAKFKVELQREAY